MDRISPDPFDSQRTAQVRADELGVKIEPSDPRCGRTVAMAIVGAVEQGSIRELHDRLGREGLLLEEEPAAEAQVRGCSQRIVQLCE